MPGDEIDVPIKFTPEGVDETVSGTARIRQEIEQLSGTTAGGASSWKQMRANVNEATGEMRMAVMPVRSLSWDFMLMGRGMSVLNHYLLGSNKLMSDAIGIIYTIGAISRIYVAIQDLMILKRTIEIMYLGGETAAHVANTAAIQAETGAKTALLAVSIVGAPISGGASLIGAGGFMGIMSLLGTMQGGGTVAQTGPYILHKGETVTPAGASSSNVIINMYTGAISSSIDIDRMLDAMAMKMAQESRRRMGA